MLLGFVGLWLVGISNVYAVIEIEITQGGESAIPIAIYHLVGRAAATRLKMLRRLSVLIYNAVVISRRLIVTT